MFAMPWNHCPIPPVVRNLLGPLRILRVPLLLWQDPCETESRTSEGNFTDDIFLCRDHNFAWESLSHTPSGPNAFGTLTALSGPLLLCRTPVQPNPEPLKEIFTGDIFLYRPAWESLFQTSSGPNAFGTLTTLSVPMFLWQDPRATESRNLCRKVC